LRSWFNWAWCCQAWFLIKPSFSKVTAANRRVQLGFVANSVVALVEVVAEEANDVPRRQTCKRTHKHEDEQAPGSSTRLCRYCTRGVKPHTPASPIVSQPHGLWQGGVALDGCTRKVKQCASTTPPHLAHTKCARLRWGCRCIGRLRRKPTKGQNTCPGAECRSRTPTRQEH
jgi:hypothetical protein